MGYWLPRLVCWSLLVFGAGPANWGAAEVAAFPRHGSLGQAVKLTAAPPHPLGEQYQVNLPVDVVDPEVVASEGLPKSDTPRKLGARASGGDGRGSVVFLILLGVGGLVVIIVALVPGASGNVNVQPVDELVSVVSRRADDLPALPTSPLAPAQLAAQGDIAAAVAALLDQVWPRLLEVPALRIAQTSRELLGLVSLTETRHAALLALVGMVERGRFADQPLGMADFERGQALVATILARGPV